MKTWKKGTNPLYVQKTIKELYDELQLIDQTNREHPSINYNLPKDHVRIAGIPTGLGFRLSSITFESEDIHYQGSKIVLMESIPSDVLEGALEDEEGRLIFFQTGDVDNRSLVTLLRSHERRSKKITLLGEPVEYGIPYGCDTGDEFPFLNMDLKGIEYQGNDLFFDPKESKEMFTLKLKDN